MKESVRGVKEIVLDVRVKESCVILRHEDRSKKRWIKWKEECTDPIHQLRLERSQNRQGK